MEVMKTNCPAYGTGRGLLGFGQNWKLRFIFLLKPPLSCSTDCPRTMIAIKTKVSNILVLCSPISLLLGNHNENIVLSDLNLQPYSIKYLLFPG
jgi:hypothetical protein